MNIAKNILTLFYVIVNTLFILTDFYFSDYWLLFDFCLNGKKSSFCQFKLNIIRIVLYSFLQFSGGIKLIIVLTITILFIKIK